MFPTHTSSSASNLVDTGTQAATVSSENSAEPKKPSLRILDGGDPATREEDLSQGPLLFNMGTGFGPPERYLELEFEGSDQPEVSLDRTLQLTPSILPIVPPVQTMSLSEVSNTGGSYSLPTDNISLTNISRFHETADSEAQMAQSTSHGVARLLPWNYEFSWKSSGLLFGNEPFEINRAVEAQSCQASPNSEMASMTTRVSYPGSQTGLYGGHESQHLLIGERLYDVGGAFMHFTSGSVDWDFEVAPDPTLAATALEKTIDWMVEVLHDKYVRSYAPQKPKNSRNTVQNQHENQAGYDPGKIERRSGVSAGRPGRLPERKAASGSGEGGDGGAGGGEQGKMSRRHFACPYMRRKPSKYMRKCMKKLSSISHLRAHVKKEHDIADEKLEAIEERAKRLRSREEQWQHFYKVLFPSEPPCPHPFMNGPEIETILAVEDVIRSGLGLKTLREALEQSGTFQPKDMPAFEQLVYEQWIPRLYQYLMHASGDNVHVSCDVPREVAHDDDQTVEPTYSDQTLCQANISLYFHSDEVIETILGIIADANYQGGEPSKVSELAHKRLFPLLCSLSSKTPSNGDVHPSNDVPTEGTHVYYQTTEPSNQYPALFPDSNNAIISRHTDNAYLQSGPGPDPTIQTSPVLDLNGHLSTMLGGFDNHPSIEGVNSTEYPIASEIRDRQLAGFDAELFSLMYARDDEGLNA